jgi:hypothetical protein
LILSHRHRFIFLKTGKTAGTSVELLLRRSCGPDDVITPVAVADEQLAGVLGVGGPQNWTPRRPSVAQRPLGIARRALGRPPLRRRDEFWNHMSASAVRNRVAEKTWDDYLKFTIVRNPWDRVVSAYFWAIRDSGPSRVALDRAISRAGRSWQVYTIDGRLAVDEVIRYECLADDMTRVHRQLGLEGPVELPRAKSSSRPAWAAVERVLTDDDIVRIGELAHHEIEMFGYRFGGAGPG